MERDLARSVCFPTNTDLIGSFAMRPVMLWVLGIPIPIIILLYLFNVL